MPLAEQSSRVRFRAWNLVGYEHLERSLKATLNGKQRIQTYVLVGGAGSGKMTVSKLLAETLLCTGSEKPCGTCEHCRLAKAGNHPDITVIDTRERIGIDAIRAVEHTLSRKPALGKWNISIVGDVTQLTPEAGNAFLKFLEEPPISAICILTARNLKDVLPTIISRAVVFRFPRVPEARIAELLTDHGVDHDRHDMILAKAQGRVGTALSLAARPDMTNADHERIDALCHLLTLPVADRVVSLSALVPDMTRENAKSFLGELSRIFEWVLYLQHDVQAPIPLSEKYRRALCATYAEPSLTLVIKNLFQTTRAIARNAGPQLALEQLMVNL